MAGARVSALVIERFHSRHQTVDSGCDMDMHQPAAVFRLAVGFIPAS